MKTMKKLITVGALGLMLGFTTLPFADTQVLGVNTPVEKEINDHIKGSYVESDHTSFYTTKKGLNKVDYSVGNNEDVSDSIIVFGVRVSSGSKI